MAYQGTDRIAEIKTLYDELAFTQNRLEGTRCRDAQSAMKRQLAQIRKNILHYNR